MGYKNAKASACAKAFVAPLGLEPKSIPMKNRDALPTELRNQIHKNYFNHGVAMSFSI